MFEGISWGSRGLSDVSEGLMESQGRSSGFQGILGNVSRCFRGVQGRVFQKVSKDPKQGLRMLQRP